LVGAPVDLTTMAMRSLGVPVPEKPFLSSEYLIDKYADLGEALDINYDRPTGSGMETLGRVMAGTAGLGGEAAALAPGIGRMFAQTTKARGAGAEVKGSGAAELEAPSSELGPMVREAGAEDFVPLEKRTGEPGTPGEVKPVLNPAVKKGGSLYSSDDYLFVHDYSPLESVLENSKQVLGEGKKGFTGEQLIPRLKKAGITNAEIEASGIGAFAASNRTVKRPASDYLAYVKENAPDVDYAVKYKSAGQAEDFEDMVGGGTFLHEDTQRLTMKNADSEVDYGELIVYNRKAPEGVTRKLTHHPDVRGSFAHVRFSDHNDASGGVSRFVEENQFDIVQQQYGKQNILEKTDEKFVNLTPEKINELEKKIQELNDSADFRALQGFRQQQLDLDAEKARITQLQRDFTSKRNARQQKQEAALDDASISFLNLGEESIKPNISQVMLDSQISVAAPKFLKTALESALRFKGAGSLNAAEAKKALTRGINLRPEEIGRITAGGRTIDDKIDLVAVEISRHIQNFAEKPFSKGALPSSSRSFSELSKAIKSGPGKDKMRKLFASVPESRQIDFKSIIKDDEQFELLRKEKSASFEDLDRVKEQLSTLSPKINEKRRKVFDGESDELVEYFYTAGYTGKPVRETNVEFVANQPFRNQKQAARHNLAMVIKDAREKGIDRIYFPDYRDVAALRSADAKAFKITYEDAPKKYIEELKKEFPDLRTGKLTPDEFAENHIGESMVGRPVTYLDLNFSRSDESIVGRDNLLPRRYAKGGPVDLRSGIGNVFKLYS
jgi:hypothetical protein